MIKFGEVMTAMERPVILCLDDHIDELTPHLTATMGGKLILGYEDGIFSAKIVYIE